MILCVGEILADMIGKKVNGEDCFSRYAGGAPFNVACDLKKLGAKVGFCGRVGEDLVGDFLADYAGGCGFDLLALQKDREHNTTLAFVELDEHGERRFSFHRRGTADYFIDTAPLESLIAQADIVHLGSLMLSERKGREIADRVIALTQAYGKRLSFDVNYREDIFQSEEQAKEIYRTYLAQADIVKFSEDEVKLFTKNGLIAEIPSVIKEGAVAFVTLGSKGSLCVYEGGRYEMNSIKVRCIDTTGAGDGFFAGTLSVLDSEKVYSKEVLERSLQIGNLCGALITTGYGAIHDGLTKENVENFANKTRW